MEAGYEPMLSWDKSFRGEPKLRLNREEVITGAKVRNGRGVGIRETIMAMVLPSKMTSPLLDGRKKEKRSASTLTVLWRAILRKL